MKGESLTRNYGNRKVSDDSVKRYPTEMLLSLSKRTITRKRSFDVNGSYISPRYPSVEKK